MLEAAKHDGAGAEARGAASPAKHGGIGISADKEEELVGAARLPLLLLARSARCARRAAGLGRPACFLAALQLPDLARQRQQNLLPGWAQDGDEALT